MSKHLLWLWLWFSLGMVTYWLKRAYYLVTGSNPVANTYSQFLQRCWIPLIVRAFLDSMVFWALFTPQFAESALNKLGWSGFAWAVAMATSNGFSAALFGHAVDSIVDMAVSKVPLIKDVLPQMPPPLKATDPAPAPQPQP